VVDRTALEMRSTRKCTGGSNPSLSATQPIKSLNLFLCLNETIATPPRLVIPPRVHQVVLN
jgi:hypothetical protein